MASPEFGSAPDLSAQERSLERERDESKEALNSPEALDAAVREIAKKAQEQAEFVAAEITLARPQAVERVGDLRADEAAEFSVMEKEASTAIAEAVATIKEAASPEREKTIEKKEGPLDRADVLAALELFGGAGGREVRSKEDADGPTILEVEIPGSQPGQVVELCYARKGRHGGDGSIVTTIEAVYYQDGVPVGGKTLANHVDGAWQFKA